MCLNLTRKSISLFSVKFESCVLDHSSFYQTKMKSTVFNACQLHEVDFTNADLQASVFNGSDLKGAVFSMSNLEQADFRNAINFLIDPEMNKVKKSKFIQSSLSGLLTKYQLEIDAV